jgi:hypothetical protein
MNVHRAGLLWRELPAIAPEVAMLLAAGGDERIRVDPATGRNRYATTATPRPEEIFLSSSTASTITPRAYRAAEAAWLALSADSAEANVPIDSWFDHLRARLNALFGIAGSEVVLTGSGTEAELVALAIARSAQPGPLTNIVLAPGETGSGVLRAAAGARFLDSSPFGEIGRAGAPLDGWAGADIEVATVEIRDRLGNLRPAGDVDAEARERARTALDAGRNVLLHRLETSKTGRSGLTAEAAAEIAASAPGRVVVVGDCCQLRCSPQRIRQFLARGFMVAITGSKFFAGPPFSGALLLPPLILERMGALTLPPGLADYSSALDWSRDLRARTQLSWINQANLGLGLRWVAALEEMERFYALPSDLRRDAVAYFSQKVRICAQHFDGIHFIHEPDAVSPDGPDSILSFVMTHPDGVSFSPAETAAVHVGLGSPRGWACGGAEQMFHLGQPVAIGPRTALRVCASAPLISAVVERIEAGEPLEEACVEWVNIIDFMFAKWRRLLGNASARRRAAQPGELGRAP